MKKTKYKFNQQSIYCIFCKYLFIPKSSVKSCYVIWISWFPVKILLMERSRISLSRVNPRCTSFWKLCITSSSHGQNLSAISLWYSTRLSMPACCLCHFHWWSFSGACYQCHAHQRAFGLLLLLTLRLLYVLENYS